MAPDACRCRGAGRTGRARTIGLHTPGSAGVDSRPRSRRRPPRRSRSVERGEQRAQHASTGDRRRGRTVRCLYAAWRQLRVSQDGLHATDVRIGGIYALWRIADHSARDHEAFVSIMAAYLRTHLAWPPREATVPAADVSINSVPPPETRAGPTATDCGCTGSTSTVHAWKQRACTRST